MLYISNTIDPHHEQQLLIKEHAKHSSPLTTETLRPLTLFQAITGLPAFTVVQPSYGQHLHLLGHGVYGLTQLHHPPHGHLQQGGRAAAVQDTEDVDCSAEVYSRQLLKNLLLLHCVPLKLVLEPGGEVVRVEVESVWPGVIKRKFEDLIKVFYDIVMDGGHAVAFWGNAQLAAPKVAVSVPGALREVCQEEFFPPLVEGKLLLHEVNVRGAGETVLDYVVDINRSSHFYLIPDCLNNSVIRHLSTCLVVCDCVDSCFSYFNHVLDNLFEEV